MPLSISDCDPDAVIREALDSRLGYTPREVWLAWLLRLPHGVDPSEAARILLEHEATRCGEAAPPVGGETITALLEQTAAGGTEHEPPKRKGGIARRRGRLQ